MYNNLKKQLLENIDTIIDMQKQLVCTQVTNSSLDLLSEFQQVALVIGEAIESNVPNNYETVKLLEEYCENVYLISEKEKITECDVRILTEQLEKVKESIKQIKVKYQIVFFPYKADMWDSLESIWIACTKDENCECKVVPIPYYEIDKTNQKWNLCYDGERFPKNVPIVHYSKYDMEMLRPDIAYIHNPYDKYNKVTMVSSAYHSKELKKYVGKLVYVPYYINTGFMSKQFENLPVFDNMDYMIAQSETMKESCREYPYYDKVLPLGSPKVDKLINLLKHGGQVPEGWASTLNGKKVLMLNTTVNDVLKNKENLFKKLRNFFEIVKREERIAVIWRPHPLIETTIKSISSELWEMYKELYIYFYDNNIGIYDVSSDITNTVVISDAYVGSPYSSVINLFGISGKPIFLFNSIIYEETKGDKNKKLTVCDGFEKIKEFYYFCCRESEVFTIRGFIEDIVEERLGGVRKRQLEANATLVANMDGTCGEKVHTFMMNELQKLR